MREYKVRIGVKEPRGEKVFRSKMTQDTVKEIRRLYSRGMLQREISKKFGIAQSQVSRIITEQNWSHV